MQTKQRPNLNETVVVKIQNEFLRGTVIQIGCEGPLKRLFLCIH